MSRTPISIPLVLTLTLGLVALPSANAEPRTKHPRVQGGGGPQEILAERIHFLEGENRRLQATLGAVEARLVEAEEIMDELAAELADCRNPFPPPPEGNPGPVPVSAPATPGEILGLPGPLVLPDEQL
jgi:hypothetical protein